VSFLTVSYNVLASGYIQRGWYRRTPALLLNPAWRVPALVRFISALDADLLCLQEVEPEMIASLRATLSGYELQYARKLERRPDGCAIVYRKNLFELIAARTVVFEDSGGVGANSGYIALVSTLRHEHHLLHVISTHLTWDPPDAPPAAQIGLRQVGQLLRETRQASGDYHGCILAGDFNATPESRCVAAIEEAGFHYAHREIIDAYTCNVGRNARTIDYLFHTPSLIAEPKAPARIDDLTVIPSAEHPSDHVPILCRFSWQADL
jgi:protein angel